MNEGAYLGPYIALKALRIPQGKGDGLLKISKGSVFSFDGDEMIDIRALLKGQSIQPYTKSLEGLEV